MLLCNNIHYYNIKIVILCWGRLMQNMVGLQESCIFISRNSIMEMRRCKQLSYFNHQIFYPVEFVAEMYNTSSNKAFRHAETLFVQGNIKILPWTLYSKILL